MGKLLNPNRRAQARAAGQLFTILAADQKANNLQDIVDYVLFSLCPIDRAVVANNLSSGKVCADPAFPLTTCMSEFITFTFTREATRKIAAAIRERQDEPGNVSTPGVRRMMRIAARTAQDFAVWRSWRMHSRLTYDAQPRGLGDLRPKHPLDCSPEPPKHNCEV